MLARQIIQRVRQIQIRTGRQVADVLAGQYVSVFRGGGVEFEEVRPYIPGDDVRSIDWNVTARVGAPFVKRYVEERQLTVMLVADISASGDFGSATRSKREAAAEFCALLAFSAIRNDDKVGLILFHGGVEQYIPPRKGQKHVLRVIREVLAHGLESTTSTLRNRHRRRFWSWRTGRVPRAARQATSIATAMQFLMKVAKRKAVCFLVSDFIDQDYERAMTMTNRKHDLIAVRVVDSRESALPNVGLIALTDAETGRIGVYDTGSAAFRRAHQDLTQRDHDALARRLATAGIDLMTIDAAGSVVDPLVKFFRLRERRMRR